MLKRAFCIFILLMAALLVANPLLAQQLAVQISSPSMGEEVRGMVPIIGSASVPDFQFYKVEFGVGASPNEWALIGSLHYEPIINGQLETWNTQALPDGVYSLRLQGVKMDGNWEEYFVRNVVISNTRPTATPTATETPTPAETAPVPTTGAEALASPTPYMTSTPIVIAPTQVPADSTPTPTLAAPEEDDASIFDFKTWGQSALYGGVAMGAVFLLLGIVFGIRKLI